MAKSTTIALDAADRRILRALQRDGRLPVTALAEAVGLLTDAGFTVTEGVGGGPG
eukprot:gene43601-53315_t